LKISDGQIVSSSEKDMQNYKDLRNNLDSVLKLCGDYWNWPLVGHLTLPSLQRILNLNYLYDRQIKAAGSILEFGVHYGSSFAQLINLRSIKEPYNYSRHIYGFDTFRGFSGSSKKDAEASDGDFYIDEDYLSILKKNCEILEKFAPKEHIKKHTLVKGDASVELKKLLKKHPELVVSMIIFDMDIYKPTKEVIELIRPRLHRNSIIVFDEFNCPHFPGETEAVIEKLNLNDFNIEMSPFIPFNSIMTFK
jgi:hypothetical protein